MNSLDIIWWRRGSNLRIQAQLKDERLWILSDLCALRLDAGSLSNPLTRCGHHSGTASPASSAGSSLRLEPSSVNIQIRALVVLSACQTGLGKEVKGEGLVGLTRGFIYAGAPRVVVSLWSVSDAATSELMTRFYGGMLKEGRRPAAALREAQISLLNSKRWRRPFYWAAFTLQGEWR